MNAYDRMLTRGLDGTALWDAMKHKVASHHDILTEMRERQVMLARYAKHNKMDSIQEALLSDIKFLETMAWRVYMFGLKNLFVATPGKMGEYRKRRRTDPGYWKMRALCGEAKADKWLKREMRTEWEKAVLNRYKY